MKGSAGCPAGIVTPVPQYEGTGKREEESIIGKGEFPPEGV
jgi:hypothetical protein